MSPQEIRNIVLEAVKDNLKFHRINLDVNDNTELFKLKSTIDSMGVIGLIVDIESRLAEKGIEISLISEKSLADKDSPFKNVSTLTDFIVKTLNTQ